MFRVLLLILQKVIVWNTYRHDPDKENSFKLRNQKLFTIGIFIWEDLALSVPLLLLSLEAGNWSLSLPLAISFSAKWT